MDLSSGQVRNLALLYWVLFCPKSRCDPRATGRLALTWEEPWGVVWLWPWGEGRQEHWVLSVRAMEDPGPQVPTLPSCLPFPSCSLRLCLLQPPGEAP